MATSIIENSKFRRSRKKTRSPGTGFEFSLLSEKFTVIQSIIKVTHIKRDGRATLKVFSGSQKKGQLVLYVTEKTFEIYLITQGDEEFVPYTVLWRDTEKSSVEIKLEFKDIQRVS